MVGSQRKPFLTFKQKDRCKWRPASPLDGREEEGTLHGQQPGNSAVPGMPTGGFGPAQESGITACLQPKLVRHLFLSIKMGDSHACPFTYSPGLLCLATLPPRSCDRRWSLHSPQPSLLQEGFADSWSREIFALWHFLVPSSWLEC